jgi:subtilisin family serine protease
MRTRRRPEITGTVALAVVAVAATGLVLVQPVSGAADAVSGAAIAAWRGVFGERPQAARAKRVIVVLSAPSVSDRVAGSRTAPTPEDERRWAADAEAAQRLLVSGLRARGVKVKREHAYTRTLNGFSAALEPRALAEVERAQGVLAVYPVRTVYPASVSTEALERPEFGAGEGRRPGIALPGFDGTGVTVALLDTGVDLEHPYLHGRVSPGYDVVARDERAAAEAKPGDPSALEAHGTRMAGLLVGRDGPNALVGLASGARVFPIRVVGWQEAEDGSFALFGRGDQLIAGLERAVDPNGDGAADDAAKVAVAALVEPYAAFADSPESRAVAGAARLGTLVVAAAGNDGEAGGGFGSIGAPGAAPAALTAGALDTRREVLASKVLVRAGLRTLFSGHARVLGALGPDSDISVAGAAALGPTLAEPQREPSIAAGGSRLEDFFDPRGVSLVAERAAVVPADGRSIPTKARNAAAAGAVALVVYGTTLPAGGLDLDDAAPIPVVAIPAPAGRAAVAALRRGETLSVALAGEERVANDGLRRVAAFSSRGLAFDGRVKPDLVAPGVSLATSEPGRNGDGAPRYATVTGSSAAAAVTAGAAALVAQARPDLSAGDLKSVLVGSAAQVVLEGLPAESVTAQGAGLVDPSAAAASQLAVEPATLAFGRAVGPNWSAVRAVTVKNLSERRLEVRFGVVRDQPSAVDLTFAAQPATISLAPGASGRVAVLASSTGRARGTAGGVLVVEAAGARSARVPWAVSFREASPEPLVGDVHLSHDSFAPSAAAPAVLAFRAGSVVPGPDGENVEPVGALELELWTARGKRLGVLAHLRDLLPGRYAFGLTGRGPNGKALRPGRYVLRLHASPVDAGDGARATSARAVFTVLGKGKP